MNADTNRNGTVRSLRARAHALGLEANANGANENEDGIRTVRTQSGIDHWGSVPDDEREFLAGGFGAELKRLRASAALSQARCGDLAGVRGDHIGRLERGQRRPTANVIQVLSRILASETAQEATQTRLTALAGTSLREGAVRKKQAKDNKNRRKALASSVKAQRTLKSIIRAKEARGEVVAGNVRNLADKLGDTVDRLRSEGTPAIGAPRDTKSLKNRGRRVDRPKSLRMKDIEAWLDSHASEPFEDDDDD